jgi:hypothetical protein
MEGIFTAQLMLNMYISVLLRSNKCLILVQQAGPGRSVDHSLMISGDLKVISSLQSATNTHNNVSSPLFFRQICSLMQPIHTTTYPLPCFFPRFVPLCNQYTQQCILSIVFSPDLFPYATNTHNNVSSPLFFRQICSLMQPIHTTTYSLPCFFPRFVPLCNQYTQQRNLSLVFFPKFVPLCNQYTQQRILSLVFSPDLFPYATNTHNNVTSPLFFRQICSLMQPIHTTMYSLPCFFPRFVPLCNQYTQQRILSLVFSKDLFPYATNTHNNVFSPLFFPSLKDMYHELGG